ncbi:MULTISPECIES: hypothetical protein [Serratia]|uniref:hypothetical protein n=1 Tax=Serratia TaxID=613 RepID=UPI0016604AB3|nr:hypothetical protein [Serratia marcescens]HAT4978871.1 hypothetical protein [Serratia marcescens]HBB7109456.1 hypothetical protein [Serratia marcescens]HBC2511412.1 hypothetical protein [Serratia marcescens]HBC2523620.1 hypothetical protein [Serratia marcescens]HBC2527945.1 hypothetical protein [Serratia marcescens]
MTTIKRFTPDYKMHAVRFEAFAREAEHGELVRFDAHQQVVSAIEAERDAQQKRADALEVRLRESLSSEQEAIQRAHAANQTIDALAVENAALKDVFGPGEAVVNFLSIALRHTKYDYIDLPDVALAFKMSLPETPATDAALAAIRNEATVRALNHLRDCQFISDTVAELKADELREGK